MLGCQSAIRPACSRHSRASAHVGVSGVRLLVTRPEPDGEETAAGCARAVTRCWSRRCCGSKLAPDADLGAGPWSGIIMTSRNAARAIERHPRCRRAAAACRCSRSGRRTAAAARAAGFSDVLSADGDADDLVRLILARRAAVGATRSSISPARTAPRTWRVNLRRERSAGRHGSDLPRGRRPRAPGRRAHRAGGRRT